MSPVKKKTRRAASDRPRGQKAQSSEQESSARSFLDQLPQVEPLSDPLYVGGEETFGQELIAWIKHSDWIKRRANVARYLENREAILSAVTLADTRIKGFWCKFQKRSARGLGRPRRKGVTRLPNRA